MVTRLLENKFVRAPGVLVFAVPLVAAALFCGGLTVRQRAEVWNNLEPAALVTVADQPAAVGPEIGQKVVVDGASGEFPTVDGYLYQAGPDGWLVVFQEPVPVPVTAMKKGHSWLTAPYFVDGTGAGVGSVIVAGRFRLDELHVTGVKLEDDLTTVHDRRSDLTLVRTLDWAHKLMWRQDVLAEHVEAVASPKHVSWKSGDVLSHPDFPGLTLSLYRLWTDCRVGFSKDEALAVVIPNGTPVKLPESLVGRYMITKDNRAAYVLPVSQLRTAPTPVPFDLPPP